MRVKLQWSDCVVACGSVFIVWNTNSLTGITIRKQQHKYHRVNVTTVLVDPHASPMMLWMYSNVNISWNASVFTDEQECALLGTSGRVVAPAVVGFKTCEEQPNEQRMD